MDRLNDLALPSRGIVNAAITATDSILKGVVITLTVIPATAQ
jgi:hypothetical protein